MYRMIKDDFKYINCMTNMIGRKLKIEENGLPFSFYFGSKKQEYDNDSVHGIMVKLVKNSERVMKQEFSILHLHGDYDFIQNKKLIDFLVKI